MASTKSIGSGVMILSPDPVPDGLSLDTDDVLPFKADDDRVPRLRNAHASFFNSVDKTPSCRYTHLTGGEFPNL